ncbi:high light inducible protein [Synechococcus sp. ATX 2A4]|uniref:high light inducible protein n=1 Tax=Synechococcus sp. ATX 2A4 TaxID=2823727 RepID=UPI0037DA53DC
MAPAPSDAEGLAAGQPVEVAPEELNAWRRGFTPQAEIWNGRLAMLGLSLGIATLLLLRLARAH